MAPDEEVLFNAEAKKHNSDFLPLFHTDSYLKAFTISTTSTTLSFLSGLSNVAGSLQNEGYMSTAQKCGLLYHIRANIPPAHTYVIQWYDGINAANCLEGAEVLSILAQLFAVLEVNPPDISDIPLQQYDLYKQPPPPTNGKFTSPDQHLCLSLAYTAFNI